LPPNNQAATQPVFNLEMANVYLKAHNPQFCERTWSLVSDEVKHTKARWGSSSAASRWMVSSKRKLNQTTSCHFLAVLDHPEAGVSTNVFFVFAS
jgi:hypothetical protein